MEKQDKSIIFIYSFLCIFKTNLLSQYFLDNFYKMLKIKNISLHFPVMINSP